MSDPCGCYVLRGFPSENEKGSAFVYVCVFYAMKIMYASARSTCLPSGSDHGPIHPTDVVMGPAARAKMYGKVRRVPTCGGPNKSASR